MSRIDQIHNDYLDPDKHLWPAEEPDEMSDFALLEQLDAYGHMTWTIGDQDWQACFDAKREGDRIAYHVVVNCESGHFIDTLEKGIIPVAEAAKLINLPEQYVDAGIEGHLEQLETPYSQRGPVGRFAWRDCARRWKRHVKQLMREE